MENQLNGDEGNEFESSTGTAVDLETGEVTGDAPFKEEAAPAAQPPSPVPQAVRKGRVARKTAYAFKITGHILVDGNDPQSFADAAVKVKGVTNALTEISSGLKIEANFARV